MKNVILGTIGACLINLGAVSQVADSLALQMEALENSLNYQTGIVELESGNATITVPPGFKFLDKKQSMFVLSELWGNPEDDAIVGMLIPENEGVLSDESWAFTISFDEMGYVKLDDAEDIDYDELLKEQQKEIRDANADRIKAGFPAMEFIGWASKPFLDADRKILHWAKELKFGDSENNTLNYNLIILGRKGIFMLNAIAGMYQLPEVKTQIEPVIASIKFKEGHKYSDFIPDVDEVAAWTVGGLVAGKVLAKAGFFVFLLKFWKIIVLALAGATGVGWKFWKGRKARQETA
jgi:uncharacterized membrane-anchored protein